MFSLVAEAGKSTQGIPRPGAAFCFPWAPPPSSQLPLLQPVSAGCDIFKSRPKLAAWRQRVEAAVGEDLFREAHAVLMKAKDLPPADTAVKERLKPLAQLFL